LVTRTEKVGEGDRGRTSFEFDALDKKAADEDILQLLKSDDTLPFASIRILTTPNRFAQVFDHVPRLGDWYELHIEPIKRPGGPALSAWHAQLSGNGYASHSRGYAVAARFLFGDERGIPGELGAAADPAITRGRRVAKATAFPEAAIASRKIIRSLLNAVNQPKRAIVHDVGQAAFVSLTGVSSSPLLHYDAGWPISYNRHTALQGKRILCDAAPVVLSHWDWDHMHGYYRFSAIQLSKWIAPVQKFGPGAARVAAKLHAAGNLYGFKGKPLTFKWGTIGLSRGTVGDNNQTGLAMRIKLGSGHLGLLVGDADYENVPFAMTSKAFNFLVVTHHGAEFEGPVPGSAGGNSCVISYGKRNVYKHPKRSAIQRHLKSGWNSLRTAAYRSMKRGDRIIQ
jgi:competence protein ComEC